MTHSVLVGVTVQAYSTLDIEADSQDEAEAKVARDIEARGWESDAWNKANPFRPDWAEAGDLRVLQLGLTDPKPQPDLTASGICGYPTTN